MEPNGMQILFTLVLFYCSVIIGCNFFDAIWASTVEARLGKIINLLLSIGIFIWIAYRGA